MKAAFYTLGCKVNQYETQAMRELFEAAGYETVDFSERADVYVINTCTVTQTADKKSRQMISRAKELSPDGKVVVTGCYAQRASDEILKLGGVDLVIGTAQRDRIVEMTEKLIFESELPRAYVVPAAGRRFEDISATREGRTRAYLKIQDGCDRFCTYCIIPYVRGNVRSRTLASIRRETEAIAEGGFKEIVLTGIHLMSYGKDFCDGTGLMEAIDVVSGVDGIERIRLGSLEPQLMTRETIEALAANRRLCRQFHLSLQSGSKTVLERMKRRYTPQEYERCVEMLREAMPECAITTDIIAGFAGETEQEFNETLDFAEKIGFSRIHVFPYSRREGTVAYGMAGQLSNAVKQERARRLIELQNELERQYLERQIGKTHGVLFETYENGVLHGHTDTYLGVNVLEPDGDEYINKIISVRINGIDGSNLTGNIDNKQEET